MNFDDFWKNYASPLIHKRRGSKVQARRIWNGKVPTKPNRVIDEDSITIEPWMWPLLEKASERQNEYIRSEVGEGYPPPMVTTFLNQHRWDDYDVELERPALKLVGE